MRYARPWQLCVLMMIAGCATHPEKTANAGPDVVCHSEQTVGSLITRPACTTRAQRAAQQADLGDLRHEVGSGAGFSGRPGAPSAQ
ncbi:MAG TPA: hypothetical protein VMF03_02270 [Steroidobacteraceae bacterium]|nr:hypothetical protein [Steroidobacteraceae bacterium]